MITEKELLEEAIEWLMKERSYSKEEVVEILITNAEQTKKGLN